MYTLRLIAGKKRCYSAVSDEYTITVGTPDPREPIWIWMNLFTEGRALRMLHQYGIIHLTDPDSPDFYASERPARLRIYETTASPIFGAMTGQLEHEYYCMKASEAEKLKEYDCVVTLMLQEAESDEIAAEDRMGLYGYQKTLNDFCAELGIKVPVIPVSEPTDIVMDETNFPDENFRSVLADFDQDGNGYLSDEEIAAVTKIDCSSKSISSLQGIEFFAALQELVCHQNELTTLDLSKNTELTILGCKTNQLTALDVSGNTALEMLYCDENQLTALDVSRNTALTDLGCRSNKLKTLDIRKNTKLRTLECSYNALKSLDIGKNTELTMLGCASNKMKKLDVSKATLINTLVKETEPTEQEDLLVWERDTDGDGTVDRLLYVDKKVQVITDEPKPEPEDISKAKVTAIKAQTYTGKAIKPTVTVKYNNKKLTKDKDYIVAYKNNKKIGKATVTIAGKGNYTGKKTVKFDIVPKAVKLSSLTAGKKELTVKWSKGSGITGYEIEYSLKKDFKDKESIIIKKAATTKTVLKKLQAKKTYYVRIRAYKTVNGKKYYSAWSAIKNKKTK